MAAKADSATPQQQAGQPPPSTFSRWVPSLPTITLNTLNPFASGSNSEAVDANSKQSQANDAGRTSTSSKRPVLSTFLNSSSNNGKDRAPSPAISHASGMFTEPDMSSNTGSNESREGSIADSGRRHKRSSNKAKTRFSICHAPPASVAMQKLHRRPRSLLQLHRLSGNARPVPAFGVIPSVNFSVRLTKAITKVFKAKHGLCPNDLVVLRAEEYGAVEEELEVSETQVIGLICKGRKDKDKDEASAAERKAKICMTNGQEWEAYPLMNGGYEFFATDEHGLGLTARWVPKRIRDGNGKTKEKRFNFSTISPNSRRHPVIANLTTKSLEVYDTYKMPEASGATPRSTPRQASTSALSEAMDDEGLGEDKEQCETDEHLREIITMTAIWVTFKEGWSLSFKHDDNAPCQNPRNASASVQNSPTKATLSGGSPLTTPPGSPAQSSALEKRNSIRSVSSSIFGKGSILTRGKRASQASIPEGSLDGNDSLGRSSSVKKTGRPRSESASTVLVHRAASNRRKNNQQATWRPDLLSAQAPLSETAREHLSRTPSPQPSTDAPWNAAPQPNRRVSLVAEPLIPVSGHEGEETTDGEEEGVDGEEKLGHDDSATSASTGTVSTARAGAGGASKAPQAVQAQGLDGQPAKSGKERKKRGWRGLLLCGKHDP